jgi:type IV secretion system protein VirB10
MTDTTQSLYGSGREAQGQRSSTDVFERFSRPLVTVGRTDIAWGFAAGLGGIVLFAAIVFLSLNHNRVSRSAAPPRHVSAQPHTVMKFTPVIHAVPTIFPVAETVVAASDQSGRLSAPAMIVDLSEPPSVVQAPAASSASTAQSATSSSSALSAQATHTAEATSLEDDTFAARVSQSATPTVYAAQLHDTRLIVPEGTVIPAILETGINSDLPGFVRAVVSRDVSGFDGSTMLIPRGSKLIGQYRSATAAGYSRAFVVWSRLLTPDGVSVDIGSPATDTAGQGGVEGETNTHFLQRFGSAILLSVLTAGLEAAANSTSNASTAVIVSTPQQANNVAAIALQKYIDVPTTITVPQGTPVRVFVARDLDFSGVPHPKP